MPHGGVQPELRSNAGRWVDWLTVRYRPVICPFQELVAFVRAGDRVCDVGCGAGQFLLLLKRSTEIETLMGIEIDERLVRRATAAIESDPHSVPCDVRVYNGIDFPDTVRECNLVFLIDVLHHVPRDRQQLFLSRLYAAIAPGARVVLKDINRRSPLVVLNKLHDLACSGAFGRERSTREARAMCEHAGFHVAATFAMRKAVYPHYFMILDKPSDVPCAKAADARQESLPGVETPSW